MLNTPWDTGSVLYRRLLISALILTGAGIALALAGAAADAEAAVFAAMPVIGAGLLCHIAGMVVRTRDARRRRSPAAPR
ncbi:hypothetical protein I6N91_05365 [Arthrobacter sp. MSA 4-2]|uniref:hypothetical protein n=1 Tax=Arthrobacter sp. MSA 4-2 TaxID=2794349 RepID=UPI0018E8FEDC|nr:hypothetical protein [Arthrobacter sp. MSA 4-2]MBJ2120403.1 hypothetical protein [Arthrobacter sp. MSA 4-2]